jgi:signal peptidase I
MFVYLLTMHRPKSLVRTILQPLAIAVGLAAAARGAMHIYSIPSRSMAPTLEVGDQIVVTRYLRAEPERGEVIVFRSPLDADVLMVKRVIGVPGDVVDSRLGRVRVGGHTLPEPYLLRAAASGAIEAQVIPANAYYVLGDNREDSLDSRTWGYVPRDLIVGRARLVLWSSPHLLDANPASARSAHPAFTDAPHRARLFKWID